MTLERERDAPSDAAVRRAAVAPAWRVAFGVVAALAGATLLVLAVPLVAGVAPVAQLVSFRAVVGLGALLAAVVVLGVPWLRRRALPLGLVLVVGGLAQAGVLAWRSVPHQAGAATGDPLVVLAFNTADVVDAPTLARLVEQQGAEVVALPETARSTAARTAGLLGEHGRRMVVESGASTVPWIQGTTMLVSTALAPGTPTTVSLPVGGVQVPAAGGAVLVAGHTTSPSTRSQMPAWRADTRALARTCADQPGAVVAGDFNATLDHPGLRDLGPCVDAAAAVGRASSGSWPASAPTWLAAPIDHVLVDARVWRVESVAVLPATGGSDHRPVVAHLVRR